MIKFKLTFLFLFFVHSAFSQGYDKWQLKEKLNEYMVKDYPVSNYKITKGEFYNGELKNGEIDMNLSNGYEINVTTNYKGNINYVQVLYELSTTVMLENEIKNLKKNYQGSIRGESNTDIHKSFVVALNSGGSLRFIASASSYNGKITKWGLNVQFSD
jgi:hypothetical protein